MGPTINSISVKVMRSYDYCHFEIALGASLEGSDAIGADPIRYADYLRKDAARLADKAVEQYIIAKQEREEQLSADRTVEELTDEYLRILEIKDVEWTPDQKALVRSVRDAMWRRGRIYNYDDDWDPNDTGEDDED